MKFSLLLLVILLATLPAPATANWKDIVATIDAAFVSQIAGVVKENFEEKVEIGKGPTANFIKAKEEASAALAFEDPPLSGAITKTYKVKSTCYHADKEATIEPDFCYQILIKQAAADTVSNTKAKMFTVVVHMSNSVVVSRIKITLASGTGNKVIRQMIIRGIVKFLAKCDQTLSTLKAFKTTIDTNLPKVVDDIAATISKRTAPTAFEIKTFKPIFGRYTKATFTSKLFEESKEPGEKLDEAVEENAPIFKLFNELKDSQKFPDSNDEIPAEFVVFRIHQKAQLGEFNQAFDNFVKRVFLIIANFGGKLSVHIRSDIFAFSKDLPVASKQLLLVTVQRLLERAIVETFISFYNLDRTVPEGLPEDTIVGWFRAIMDGLASPAPFKEEVPNSNHYIADFMIYKIQIRGYVVGGHGDFMVRVLLNREGQAVLDRVNYFPLKSQYILAPLVQSFIQKTCHEFYETIYAGMVIPGFNEQLPSNNEDSQRLFTGDAPISEDLKSFFKRKMELGLFLSENKVVPFILETAVQKAIDSSILSDPDKGEAQVIKYMLEGTKGEEKEKHIKITVKEVTNVEFETTQISEVETTITKLYGGQVVRTDKQIDFDYATTTKTDKTLTYTYEESK